MSFGRHLRLGLLALSVAVVFVGQAAAQDANGTVSGTVADEQGQVLPGATVTLINENTKSARTEVSDARGDYRFTTLVPGTYTLKIELQGFKTYERRSNTLSAASTLSIGTVKLGLGAMTEIISVVDEGTKVNVEESQHSGLLTSNQIEQLQSKGRDVMNLLRVIPGVRYGEDTDSVGDSFGTEVPNISGQRSAWNRVTVDGLNGNELSGTNRIASAVNLDAIAEVKVLLNTYKAEFGGTGGANIQIVSKGGGTEYRGNLYWYGRRTSWNANRWEANRQEIDRGYYNFNTYGFNLGGPVPLSKDDKKLFFFYSLEAPQIERPGPVRSYFLPTAEMRNGDFSQVYPYGNPTGTKPAIVDPVTGVAFANNQIPAGMINPSMQAMMNLYPLPNRLDTTETKGQYNYVTQNQLRNPRWNHLLRFDWKPSEKDSIYIAARMHKSYQDGSEGTAGASDWGFFDSYYDFADKSMTLGHTRIFSSSVINEFSAGIRQQDEGFGAEPEAANLARVSRSSVGYAHGQFHPQQNALGLIPRVNLDNINGAGIDAPDFAYDNRFGETAHDYVGAVRDNITWTKSAHTLKGGVMFEYVHNNEARGGDWMGVYTFDNANRTANPLSMGHPYANMLTGTFRTYTEHDTYRSTANRQGRVEWYVQDSWKASRRLTLDLGLRFLWYEPYHQATLSTAGFDPARYVQGASPRMYVPAPGNTARDLVTGETKPTGFASTFVPGTGDRANGMVSASDPDYPKGFRENQGIHPEPRIGIAYDLFGNGKTALHTSAGLFHQGYLGGGSQGNLQGPPNFNQTNISNGQMSNFLSTGSVFRPGDVNGLERDAKTPAAYNFSLGVQQELGWGTVVDVTYVGNVQRHLEMQVNYNEIPAGKKFPGASPNPLIPTSNLPDQFLRPFIGYNAINVRENWGTANYNALQAQLNRRYTKGLQFSFAYTWSKAMGLGDGDPASISLSRPLEQYYAPLAHNQAHNFVANFTYDFPKLSKVISAAPVRFLFDNWQISGEYVYASGDWQGVSLSTTPSFDFTGGSEGARPVMTGNPRKKDGSLFDPANPWFDTSMFARPSGRGDYGNTPRAVFQRPPINSLNTSLFKNFPMGGRRRVQLRLEGYNVLNHTQIRNIDNTARFDANGVQVNANFGLATTTGTNVTRPPRILQASVRLSF